MNKELITIRTMRPDDENFIFNSWLKSMREEIRDIPNDEFYKMNHAIVEAVLKKAKVYLAVSNDDDSFIYGYAVIQMIDDIPILHFCYTKHPFRNLGIFKTIISQFWEPKKEHIITTYKSELRRKLMDKYKMSYQPKLIKLGVIP